MKQIETILIILLSFTSVLGFLLWLRAQRKLSSVQSELSQIQLENRHLQTEKELLQKHHKDSQQNFESLKGEIQSQFVSLASQALEGSNRQFVELAKSVFESHNKENLQQMGEKQNKIESLVQPLSQALEKYHSHSQQMIKDRERGFATIEEQLKRVAETTHILSRETTALKDALKKPHVRGRWGEVQLKNCIELAGMSEHCDVNFQDTINDEESTLRPDMIVKMPGGRVVVVDAKTPLDAFISALESERDEDREAQLARHGRHLKEHVKKLSNKNYAQAYNNSADFTVMFLPNESFLYAALETQKDLVEYALEHKILIATPPTLIGLLKVIRYGWNEERLAENAEHISKAGIELHKRVCDFMEAYENIGKSLEKAQQEYETGYTRLSSRVLVQAKRLEKLGAKSKKSLPNKIETHEQLEDASV